MARNNIERLEIDETGVLFTVKYYSGTERSYSRETLPDAARKFFADRVNRLEKVFMKELPKFGPGKNNCHIIGVQKYYVIVD